MHKKLLTKDLLKLTWAKACGIFVNNFILTSVNELKSAVAKLANMLPVAYVLGLKPKEFRGGGSKVAHKKQQKLLDWRVKKTKFIVKILQLVPYLKCVILNGSLAEAKVSASSDIDLLIIAQRGRIFSVRFFALFLVWILGQKRSSDESKPHSGKFCLNYFMANDYLTIPHHRNRNINLYCAKNYSQSILLWGDRKIFLQYYLKNIEWMKGYLPIFNDQFPIKENSVSKQFPINNIRAKKIASVLEKLLSAGFGDRVERFLKKIQLKKINKDPRTKKHPDYVAANDKELRFHSPKKELS